MGADTYHETISCTRVRNLHTLHQKNVQVVVKCKSPIFKKVVYMFRMKIDQLSKKIIRLPKNVKGRMKNFIGEENQ